MVQEGVPLMVPLVESSFSPSGRGVLAEMDHVYGAVPPVAVKERGPYTTPLALSGKYVVVIDKGLTTGVVTVGALMTMDKDCEAVCVFGTEASPTVTEKEYVPALVGVPRICCPCTLNPGGKDPEERDQL